MFSAAYYVASRNDSPDKPRYKISAKLYAITKTEYQIEDLIEKKVIGSCDHRVRSGGSLRMRAGTDYTLMTVVCTLVNMIDSMRRRQNS